MQRPVRNFLVYLKTEAVSTVENTRSLPFILIHSFTVEYLKNPFLYTSISLLTKEFFMINSSDSFLLMAKLMPYRFCTDGYIIASIIGFAVNIASAIIDESM